MGNFTKLWVLSTLQLMMCETPSTSADKTEPNDEIHKCYAGGRYALVEVVACQMPARKLLTLHL